MENFSPDQYLMALGGFEFDPKKFILWFPPFLVALVFHEWGHARMAKYWGDPTGEQMGRLTLNPVPHIDVMGTLLLPGIMLMSNAGFLFGWAKPVDYDPARFKKFRIGLFWVASAGPLMNFVLAVVSAFALVIASMNYGMFKGGEYEGLYTNILTMCNISVLLNLFLGVFNLLPIPPLDGSKIVESFLKYETYRKYMKLRKYSFFIFLVLYFSGFFGALFAPINTVAVLLIAVIHGAVTLFWG